MTRLARFKWSPVSRRPVACSRRFTAATLPKFFEQSDEVRQAVHEDRPCVALETTIYTHGWRSPENLELAKKLDALVRANGAVPAHIGILNGRAKVGLSLAELEELLDKRSELIKISTRDLPFAIGLGLSGGTTIASTMHMARMANISVFATGGLGGVHRGAESSMDVSADLLEFGTSGSLAGIGAQRPIALVASGCKGFLDIPKTLEVLETHSVPVGTFADGREGSVSFPAFWTRESSVKSPYTLRDEREAAEILRAGSMVRSGMMFANPVPEHASIPLAEMETMIGEAIASAERSEEARGNANTPFILRKLDELSNGRTRIANEALIESNVIRGCKIAVAHSELNARVEAGDNTHGLASRRVQAPAARDTAAEANSVSERPRHEPNVLVAGSLAIDTCCDYSPLAPASPTTTTTSHAPQEATSNPSQIRQTLGGVGQNLAMAAHRAGARVSLLSAVGDDHAGRFALSLLHERGLDTRHITTAPSSRTGQYVAVNTSHGDLHIGMADFAVLEDHASTLFTTTALPALDALAAQPNPYLVLDANWPAPTLHSFIAAAQSRSITTAFEPVSVAKAARLFTSPALAPDTPTPSTAPKLIDLVSPNASELSSLHAAATAQALFDRQDWWAVIDALHIPASGARERFVSAVGAALTDQGVPQMSIRLLPFLPVQMVKLGPRGVLLTMLLAPDHPLLTSAHILSHGRRDSPVGGVYMRLFAPPAVLREGDVVGVNGAGDTFFGAVLGRLSMLEAKEGLSSSRVEELIDYGQRCAGATLRSRESVGNFGAECGVRLKETA